MTVKELKDILEYIPEHYEVTNGDGLEIKDEDVIVADAFGEVWIG